MQTLERLSTPCLSFKEADLATYDKILKVSLHIFRRVMERVKAKEEKMQRHDNPRMFGVLWTAQN